MGLLAFQKAKKHMVGPTIEHMRCLGNLVTYTDDSVYLLWSCQLNGSNKLKANKLKYKISQEISRSPDKLPMKLVVRSGSH